ncbi:unnamed protein product [Ectocarpus sp. CCAP 1310/34]|nr:unnamed protein product [Ectocarpus sp. CCAP 1310/34]
MPRTGLGYMARIGVLAPVCDRKTENKKTIAQCAETRILTVYLFISIGRLLPLKVILSTHAVVANGGMITLNGSHAVALAAHDLSVPVVCFTGLSRTRTA